MTGRPLWAPARTTLPVLLSWMSGASLYFYLREGFPFHDLQPSLPLVSLPFDPRRDVVSSVPMLFFALVAAFVCASITEVAKARSVQQGRRAATFYIVLMVYQLILVADIFRAYAYDWWTWFLSWTGFGHLDSTGDLRAVSGLRLPWLSGIAALLAIAIIGIVTRVPQATSARQPTSG
jgi:hypothetical protein